MRNAFASTMTKLAQEDPRIVLLSGDIGNKLFDSFKERCTGRFFNCGVAEANMTSMAAGMALCGMRPVTYTIASFVTVRCLEQIRIDVCYHNLPVIIVGVGAGLSYAELGATHHSCEDLAVMRALPNMTVICPADTVEVRLALSAAFALGKPVYIRMGKKNEPVVYREDPDFQIGRGIVVRQGKENICLIGTGNILPVVMETADLLAAHGIDTQVVSMHTVKPLDEALLARVFSEFEIVATVEEHSLIGGLGGSVAEWLGDRQPKPAGAEFLRFGVPDAFIHGMGRQKAARRSVGLDGKAIADIIREKMVARHGEENPNRGV
ncbi:MAG: Apulose-4-phosphate transketolase subunit B [Syntrophus sp. SKADARSKE-3]|nr:Apulose-4-phosphate transketolase subunit B [Syntrophus sp. SKADARSKE-3]